MSLATLFDQNIFVWVIIPCLIILARILDVSLGTMRIIFVSRGMKYLAPLVGFFEVTIWLIAIRAVLENLNNIACYLAYGAGFAMGTYIGLFIERKLAIGSALIRIITQKDAADLVFHLRCKGFGVTSMDAEGIDGKVNIIYLIIKRQDHNKVTEIIRKFNPKAFYTLEHIQYVSEGIFPFSKTNQFWQPLLGPFRFWRKSK
ncbi:MAG: DUF2179 domain-containing protein [Candidatus Aminicenantes bacterium]|nr:MAG: DUF2179 domain-containing protein [Candidatus Aminicenantes bacterium]